MPQLEDGYAPIAKELLRAYYEISMPDSARRILLLLIHDIYGWVGRKEIELRQQDIANRIKLDRRSMRRGLKWLIETKIIHIKGRNHKAEKATIYSINKYYKTWELGRNNAPQPKGAKSRHRLGQNRATGGDKIAPCTPIIKESSFNQKNKTVKNPPEKLPYGEVIDYLNFKLNKNYKTVDKNKKLIKARFNEGHTLEDFKIVIDNMQAAWGKDAKMKIYLRPSTLFGNKFDDYRNMTAPQKQAGIAEFLRNSKKGGQ